MNFEDFKSNASIIKQKILDRYDEVHIDKGTMTIYSENINKYLEEYGCKNVEDLEETMWASYGVLVKIID